jgi:putative ATP-dependent endonuclease of OLD family
MYIAELKVENFRVFGEGENAAVVRLRPGLTAIVGENDSGKTAIVDALRLVLGTRDQEFFRIDDDDFHCASDGNRRKEIRIRCRFDGLTIADRGAFTEYLTYEEDGGARTPVIYLNWKAVANERRQRRFVSVEVRSGADADGPLLDPETRVLLCATYLRPLRDAERALSAGRGSRLSQILQHTEDIATAGAPYEHAAGPPADLGTLSILGIGDLANTLLKSHASVTGARDRLNEDYLRNLSFAGSELTGDIGVAGGDEAARLRQLLEKLELQLQETGADHFPRNRGLGSNNLLFMACELLLLGSEDDGFPFLLIEEPEAHLHPQRQLRLMRFLQSKSKSANGRDHEIQILVTTHSPNLASAIDLDNLVLLRGGKAYSLASAQTRLGSSDYRFLQRFLDVTKANLFFARGVLIVEGDAENILVPTIASLIDRDLTRNGVSIVNVGGVGMRRYAKIFQRENVEQDGEIGIPVACLTDFDVMPDCAPEIVGRVTPGEEWPQGRRWKVEGDFGEGDLDVRRQDIRARASGQSVETFVSDHWTLEYDLAFAGLGREVFLAIALADNDQRVALGEESALGITRQALKDWETFAAQPMTEKERASKIYAPLAKGSVSKPVAAQYLARILTLGSERHSRSVAQWRGLLPRYLVEAIEFVTPDAGVAPDPAADAPAEPQQPPAHA